MDRYVHALYCIRNAWCFFAHTCTTQYVFKWQLEEKRVTPIWKGRSPKASKPVHIAGLMAKGGRNHLFIVINCFTLQTWWTDSLVAAKAVKYSKGNCQHETFLPGKYPMWLHTYLWSTCTPILHIDVGVQLLYLNQECIHVPFRPARVWMYVGFPCLWSHITYAFYHIQSFMAHTCMKSLRALRIFASSNSVKTKPIK